MNECPARKTEWLKRANAIFGVESFRPLQLEAIQADLDSRDSLVVMPTGGGKSLCYQLPPFVKGGLTVVVSPLLSLMHDQVGRLNSTVEDNVRANVPGNPEIAVSLDSTRPEIVARAVANRVVSGDFKLLYLSPERVLRPETLTMLLRSRLRSIVIDEAHCISEWGDSFRPAYANLGSLRKMFDGVAIHAYTATATARVRREIIQRLGMRDPVELVGSFDRPNLHLDVVRCFNPDREIIEFVRLQDGAPGIVYCQTRAETYRVATMLTDNGVRAAYYHAGMGDAERKTVQDRFAGGSRGCESSESIIVATIAFGMGIDRSDVRWVLHASMPPSIEVYHQEIGRAGRDGEPATCMLLFAPGDEDRWLNIFEVEAQCAVDGDQHHCSQVARLDRMMGFCVNDVCRHKQLTEYFGERIAHCKKHCDVCVRERSGK